MSPPLPSLLLSLLLSLFLFLSLFLSLSQGAGFAVPRYGVSPTTTMGAIWGRKVEGQEGLNIHFLFSMRNSDELNPRFMCGIEGLANAAPSGVIINLWLIGKKEVYEELISFTNSFPFTHPPKIHFIDLATFFIGTPMEKIYTPQNVLDMERWFWGEKGAVGGGGGEGVVEGEQRRARLQQILKNLEGGKRGEGEEGKGVGGKHVSNWMEHPLGRFWVTNLCNAARLLIVHKYGGMYLDLDFFALKDPRHLPDGFGYQGKSSANGAAILFRNPGFEWLKRVQEDFTKNYNGNMWGNNGPLLMSRTLPLCNATVNCKLEIWPKDAVYTFSYTDFESYAFEDLSQLPQKISSRYSKALTSSILMHFWNKVIVDKEKKLKEKVAKLPQNERIHAFNNTLYGNMFYRTCPKIAKKAFGTP